MNSPERSEARENARTNMFLGAALRGSGLSAPVRIRNMSAAGALVEGPAKPQTGAEVQLVRGRLLVSGVVAWRAEGRLGLRFGSLVCVADWLAPSSNGAQQRVDDTVRLLQLGALPVESSASRQSQRSDQVGDDLKRIARLVGSLADQLSGDADILVRHGEALQNLEIAVQGIDFAAEMLGGRAVDEAAMTRMESLRSSCAAALEKLGRLEPEVVR